MYERLPPIPTDQQQRVEHQRLRWRLMYGLAEPDIRARLKQAIGHVRQEMWGPVDMTSNPFQQVWSQAAALYSRQPVIRSSDLTELQVDAVAMALEDAGYWQLMQRVQRDTLALREMPVFIDQPGEDGALNLRPVPPYLITVTCPARDPQQPSKIAEWRQDPSEPGSWHQYCWEIRDGVGYYWVQDLDGVELTEQVLGGYFSGEEYPWQTPEGPILPWVTYHAARTPWYWDPYTGREVVEGTLQLGVLMTHYAHLVQAASWAQRYAFGAEPAGMDAQEGGQAGIVTADPATVVMMRPTEDSASQALIGQWSAPGDPEKILASIMTYERRLVDMALGSAQVTRASSDMRSGYSLAVSRESQRELQRSYEPMFRRSDQDLIQKVAGLMGIPFARWGISYHSIPRDPNEVRSELDRMVKQIDAGLLDKITAYQQLHPGLSRADAITAVAQIEAVNTGSPPEESTAAAEVDGTPVVIAGADKAQDTALNGAQVQAAQGIVESVALGQLPRETGIQMLINFFNIPADLAAKLMGTVGTSFRPTDQNI